MYSIEGFNACIKMHVYLNGHVDVSMLTTVVFLHIYSKASVDHLKSCIFILLVFTEPLMPLGSRACIKASAHEQEICLLSPKRVGVSELRLSLSLWDQTHSASSLHSPEWARLSKNHDPLIVA